jgi:tetratricopeptide (TPR) repeat protein
MFDKSKAMRSAERYLSQGKIRDAINEYRKVVDHEPRDIVTLNMLGDLYSKDADVHSAVNCYRSVAEHYSNQGFAQKAIAVYNKISRLQPGSLEVSQKLAELYKQKGSLKEAKSHYETLAEHYNKQGRRVEALEILNEIASLDPNNVEVYLKVADAHLQDGRLEEAAEAFCNAGDRFLRHSSYDDAFESFEKALAIDLNNARAIGGAVHVKFAMNLPQEAISLIESRLEPDPLNRDMLTLLAEVQLRLSDAAAAEQTLLRLVEVDPSCYMKCLDLASLYSSLGDVESSVRILTIASEHMLVGGQASELQARLETIDASEPGRLDVVRLLARFCSWQKDDEHMRTTLVRLAEIAGREGSLDDERYALSQLVIMMPQETSYAERLKAVNKELGIPDEESPTANGFDRHFVRDGNPNVADSVVSAHTVESDDFAIVGIVAEDGDEEPKSRKTGKKPKRSKSKQSKKEFDWASPESDDEVPLAETGEVEPAETPASEEVPDGLQKEIESIRFYIENGYCELASKAINELKGTYGERPEIDELAEMLGAIDEGEVPEATPLPSDTPSLSGHAAFDISNLRSELGLEEAEPDENTDFETAYQTAVAYQEMGLMEQAIREFQDAAALVSPNDGSRRFFNCANLLGHCFMEMGKPNLAVKWHLRSLESFEISDEERQGVWYELGIAYEAAGDLGSAGKYFEQVYAENIDFRDISTRIKNLAVPA